MRVHQELVPHHVHPDPDGDNDEDVRAEKSAGGVSDEKSDNERIAANAVPHLARRFMSRGGTARKLMYAIVT